MKLTVTDETLFEGIQAAFDAKECFVLTGAGVSAEFVARGLSHAPATDETPAASLKMTLMQVSDAGSTQYWNGEGSPPVGVEAEVEVDDAPGKWVRGVVKAYDGAEVVWREQETYLMRVRLKACCKFRKLRTAEEIAEEERFAATQQLLADFGEDLKLGTAQLIVDAGYRKVTL